MENNQLQPDANGKLNVVIPSAPGVSKNKQIRKEQASIEIKSEIISHCEQKFA